MEYLLLWSGDVRGMKKARVDSTPSTGIIGHYDGRDIVKPNSAQVRAALPYRFRAAFDRANGYWFDKNRNDAPAICDLYSTRGKLLVKLYLQPLAMVA